MHFMSTWWGHMNLSWHLPWQFKHFLTQFRCIVCYKFALLICRWYHSSLTSMEAQTLLLSKGENGSFLVRNSSHNPGYYILSARVDKRVSHIIIRNIDGVFDLQGGPIFDSLTQLIEHYMKNPMVEMSGLVIHLKYPLYSTSFLPANIFQRVFDLQKQKAGFWEEFEVCRVVCVFCIASRHEADDFTCSTERL